MMIGTLVRCPISKIVGVTVPTPEHVSEWADISTWVLVTSSKDGKYVGTVHEWGKDHLEVLSESR